MYILKGKGDIYNIKQTLLDNRGVSESLLDLDDSVIEDYMHYDNIIEGVELLYNHIENNSKILIVVD